MIKSFQNDIEQLTSIPFLGFIGKIIVEGINCNHRPKSSIAESLELLGQISNFLDKEVKGGKTLNFHFSLAERKHFVLKTWLLFMPWLAKRLFFGADLRKPKLYIDFDKENHLDFHHILQNL